MLRTAAGTFAWIVWITAVQAAAAPLPPTGALPDTLKPTAYRLQLTVDPEKAEFQGHTEIDAVLTQATQTIFLHGNGLRVRKAQIAAGGSPIAVRYSEVHESGVARLDAPSTLPAGKLTLTFDYSADFRTTAEGLFRAKVGDSWYAWTQMEPIDARRVFPSFDQPGFKTPFAVTVTAPKSAKVFANAPEASSAPAGEMIVHRFAPTQPLPTYLVALGVGPFDVVETTAAPNAVRSMPLALRVIATKGQAARMRFALAEGPKLLASLEKYLGSAYPYEKLDLLSSPLMGGAMENAGLIIFDDAVVLLSPDAPLRQLRRFAEVTAHEMAHQWFGDLVTPAWWTDIWLNESFAEWMGKKIGDQWRPDLGIAASELTDAFSAMDTDSLNQGRPIRQPIIENKQIASAFDGITYQKGAQVLSMFESYLGAEKFAQGVRRHLERYRHGNATAEDFFRSLGEAAGDPKIVAAMRTFTDQTGVPLVTATRDGQNVTLNQSRYRRLGTSPPWAPQTWIIPVCLHAGAYRSCHLLEGPSLTVPGVPGGQALVANAGGSGYYRFRLDDAQWDRLIAAGENLPGREALALADSVWADFMAGTGSFERVIAAAHALSGNAERLAAIELANRLEQLASSALTEQQIVQYRVVMRSIYGPRLAALGFDPASGAHSKDTAARQALRQSLVPLVAMEARDPDLRSRLVTAAVAALNGNIGALDPAFRSTALGVAVQDLGAPFMSRLRDAMVKSTDPLFRRHSSEALGAADTPTLAESAFKLAFSPDVQPLETVIILLAVAQRPGAREVIGTLVDKNFERVVSAFPAFSRTNIPRIYQGLCSPGDAQKVAEDLQPRLSQLGGGELEVEQAKERITLCVALKKAKGEEISKALQTSAQTAARAAHRD